MSDSAKDSNGAADAADVREREQAQVVPSEEQKANQLDAGQPENLEAHTSHRSDKPNAGPTEPSVQTSAACLDIQLMHVASEVNDRQDVCQANYPAGNEPAHVESSRFGAGEYHAVGHGQITEHDSPSQLTLQNTEPGTKQTVSHGSVEGTQHATSSDSAQACHPEVGARQAGDTSIQQDGFDGNTPLELSEAISQAEQPAFDDGDKGQHAAAAAAVPEAGAADLPVATNSESTSADCQARVNIAPLGSNQVPEPPAPTAADVYGDAEQWLSPVSGEPNFLPPFANVENKALNREIKGLEQTLDATGAALEELADRTGVMDEHLRNVKTELAYTQQRVTSKAKEVQSELHLRALNQRESARMHADMKALHKERSELQERNLNLQSQIYRANERMDQFKVLMNWNQEELEQWALTQQQKEEDNEALAAYRAQDDSKLKELNMAVERMSKTVHAYKAELDREVTDTQAAQVQLDKAADDFAVLHKERQDLIRQWEDAQEQMRRNDDAIQAATQLFADKKVHIKDRQAKLDIAAKMLDDELVNNKEREAQIDVLNREIEQVHSNYSAEQAQLKELSDQVEILKSALSKAGNDHEAAQAENQATQVELEKKRLRLDDMRNTLEANRRKLESDYMHLETLEAKEKELEALRIVENKRMTEVDRKLSELEKVQFHKAQELFKQRAQEKDLISEICGGQAQNRNLVTKIQRLDDQVIRQQELLYNVEFQLQQMERKVGRAKGERSDEESNILNTRIKELTAQLDAVNEQHSMLLAQVRKAEDDLSKAVKANTKLMSEQKKVKEDMAALKMETDMIVRSVKTATNATQQRMVDLDVHRLQIQNLRKALNVVADEVFTLENKKFQLQQSLHERRHEIDVHRQTLEAELKLTRDDCHRVTLELQERRLRVSRLEAKFGVLSSRSKSLYEEEEPKSQAYYVIKNAQEREELQKRGDTLDSENKRLEREVAALEQTLEQMVESNTAYHKSFKPVNEKRAFEERAKLRQKLDQAYDRLKFKRQDEHALLGDTMQAEARCAQLQEEEAGISSSVQQLAQRRDEAADAIQDQEELLERAQSRYNHAAMPEVVQTLVPRVKAHLLQQCNSAMVEELQRVARMHPSLGIQEALEHAGVRFSEHPREFGLGSEQLLGTNEDEERPGSAASLSHGMGPAHAVEMA